MLLLTRNDPPQAVDDQTPYSRYGFSCRRQLYEHLRRVRKLVAASEKEAARESLLDFEAVLAEISVHRDDARALGPDAGPAIVVCPRRAHHELASRPQHRGRRPYIRGSVASTFVARIKWAIRFGRL